MAAIEETGEDQGTVIATVAEQVKRVPEMSPNRHQQPMIITSSKGRT